MKHSVRSCVALAVLFLVSAANGQDASITKGALKEDLKKMQGTWVSMGSRNAGPEQQSARVVKEIEGNRDIVTYYDKDGKVVRSHTSEFKLEDGGSVRIYTFSNMQITQGDGAGATYLTDRGVSFVYRVEGNTVYEVHGILSDGRPQASNVGLIVWKRLTGDDE